VKVAITVAALYYVFKKIDVEEFYQNLLQVNIGWFLLAFLLYNVSKSISALRTSKLYSAFDVFLDKWVNLKLYYIGMFYNLFLPGAIGGDGYKVYLLKQSNKEVKTRLLVSATLLDRLSGMSVLFFLACLFFLFSSFESPFPYVDWIAIALAVLVFPVFYLFVWYLFPVFTKVFGTITLQSFGVQLAQVVGAICLLMGLGIYASFTDYLTLFLISSVVAVLPFTVGGVGARELVFLYGYQYLNIDESKAIAFTILFFIINALTALIGLFFSGKGEFRSDGKGMMVS
jgi:hypothetical protein